MEDMKFFGWGIESADDWIDPNVFDSKENAERHLEWKQERFPDRAPHRLVELFYKDEQP